MYSIPATVSNDVQEMRMTPEREDSGKKLSCLVSTETPAFSVAAYQQLHVRGTDTLTTVFMFVLLMLHSCTVQPCSEMECMVLCLRISGLTFSFWFDYLNSEINLVAVAVASLLFCS